MLKLKSLKVKLIKYLVFLIVITFVSCKSNQEITEDKMVGSWDIIEMNYKNIDYKEKLLINTFTMYRDGKITIPDTIDSEILNLEPISKWQIKQKGKNNIKVIIDCKKNLIFQGKYHVTFFKNYDKKLLGIELKSDSTFIKAYKVLQNFDVNGMGWEN